MAVPDTAPKPSRARTRTGGVVVPRKLKWRHHLAAWFIAFSIRAISSTWRCRLIDPAGVFNQPPGQMIYALWHNRLAVSMVMWERWGRPKSHAAGLVALISASHDGGILSRALKYFDVEAVRGSSSRRGAQALLELTSWSGRRYNVAITPDGPRGPRYVVQDGVIALAQLTGLPILPVSTYVRRKVALKSWDQFQIPLPFARCDIRIGDLLYVPREITADQRNDLKRELERRMSALTVD